MVKKYAWIRIHAEAKRDLNERLDRINNVELKKIGVIKSKINQIDLTKFLFKNRTFISDAELKRMAKKKFSGKLC